MSRTVLSLDLGSSFTKVHLVDPEGRIPFTARRPAPMRFLGPSATQSVDATLADLTEMVRAAADTGHAVEGIIATGQMGGYVPLRADGTPLGPLDSYLDTRFEATARRVMARWGTRVWQRSGGNPFVAPKLGRALAEGEFPSEAVKAVSLSAIPAMVWCGLPAEEAFVDRSQVWLWGAYHALEHRWDEELTAAFGVPQELLPQVVEPWRVVGHLRAEWAARLGLPSGLPVFAGAGDGMVGWFGAGAGKPGMAVDTAGTTSHLGIALSQYLPDGERKVVACMPAIQPGLWFHQGWAAGSGLAYAWVMDHLKDADLEAAARVPPGSDGVSVMPFFAGRTSPDQPQQRGAVLGLRPHHTGAHLVRATLEAIAYAFYHWAGRSRDLGGGLGCEGVLAVGSGAENALWLQIKADLLGATYLQPPEADYAARGLGRIAWYGLGEGPLEVEAPNPAQCRQFEPDPVRGDRYRALAEEHLAMAEVMAQRFWNARGNEA